MPHLYRMHPTTSARRRRPAARRRWYESRRWYRYLNELLRYRARRRYTLTIDVRGPAGATNVRSGTSVINPLALPPPPRPLRRYIRHCPRSRAGFEQTLAVALVEHEAAHVRDSGDKPQHLLGWVWNALEDERIERRDPTASLRYDFLGDVLLFRSARTHDLLAGCLLWRWQWDRLELRPRFCPSDDDLALWEQHIRPRVEAAWRAPTSDHVVTIARDILALLGLEADDHIPEALPASLCGCDTHGEPRVPSPNDDTAAPASPMSGEHDGAEAEEPPMVPPDAQFAGHDASHTGDHAGELEERDASSLLGHIEGPARMLARVLTPPEDRRRTQPHRSRGTVVLDRVLAASSRPLDVRVQPAPRRRCVLWLLVDVSHSMTTNDHGAVPLDGARELAMLVFRACVIAAQPLAIWAFSDADAPIVLQPVGTPRERVPNRIAGLRGMGGTRLGPVFEAAVAALAQRPEDARLLVVVHDGELERTDAMHVQQVVRSLARHRVLLLPLYVGRDSTAVERNRRVFGHVLACPHVQDLVPLVCAWIRASLGSTRP